MERQIPAGLKARFIGGAGDRAGFQLFRGRGTFSWGDAPGWDEGGPLALRARVEKGAGLTRLWPDEDGSHVADIPDLCRSYRAPFWLAPVLGSLHRELLQFHWNQTDAHKYIVYTNDEVSGISTRN